MVLKREQQYEKELYERALEVWGKTAQTGMFYEEMGELIVAMNKITRKSNGGTKAEVIEEMADVEIMVGQMMLLFGISRDEVLQIKEQKLQRLHQRLDKCSRVE